MANTSPIWSKEGNAAWATLTTANTATDGTGTVETIFTADATNGGKVEKIIAEASGTNTASVLRIFINNGTDPSTATNNVLFRQVSLPTTTLNQVAGQNPVVVYLNIALPAGYKINVTIGTTVAAGWAVTAIGGNY